MRQLSQLSRDGKYSDSVQEKWSSKEENYSSISITFAI